MHIPLLPLTNHKYKTRFSFHIFLFAPLKLNFMALSQRKNTCSGALCIQAKCATSVSPPQKVIDVLMNAYTSFIRTCNPNFFKVLHQFLGIHHVSCCYPNGLFLMISSPFHHILLCVFKFFFHLGFLHLRMPSTSYSK